MAMPSADTDELARFGYQQELDRSLGLFSWFGGWILIVGSVVTLAAVVAVAYGEEA